MRRSGWRSVQWRYCQVAQDTMKQVQQVRRVIAEIDDLTATQRAQVVDGMVGFCVAGCQVSGMPQDVAVAFVVALIDQKIAHVKAG